MVTVGRLRELADEIERAAREHEKGFAMHEGQPPVRFVTLRIGATIANEYANRCPGMAVRRTGRGPQAPCRWIWRSGYMLDAEYNSDRGAQDVGEYGMPLPIFNAYRALARQARAAITAENSGTT